MLGCSSFSGSPSFRRLPFVQWLPFVSGLHRVSRAWLGSTPLPPECAAAVRRFTPPCRCAAAAHPRWGRARGRRRNSPPHCGCPRVTAPRRGSACRCRPHVTVEPSHARLPFVQWLPFVPTAALRPVADLRSVAALRSDGSPSSSGCPSFRVCIASAEHGSALPPSRRNAAAVRRFTPPCRCAAAAHPRWGRARGRRRNSPPRCGCRRVTAPRRGSACRCRRCGPALPRMRHTHQR